jgi:hypothetical protein
MHQHLWSHLHSGPSEKILEYCSLASLFNNFYYSQHNLQNPTFVEAEETQFLDNSPGSDLGAISNLPHHLQPNLQNLLPL